MAERRNGTQDSWRVVKRAMSWESLPNSQEVEAVFAEMRAKYVIKTTECATDVSTPSNLLSHIAAIKVVQKSPIMIGNNVSKVRHAKANRAITIADEVIRTGFTQDKLGPDIRILIDQKEGRVVDPKKARSAEITVSRALGPSYKVMLEMIFQNTP